MQLQPGSTSAQCGDGRKIGVDDGADSQVRTRKRGFIMADEAQISSGQVLTFGPFRLRPVQRLLQEGERPVRLGSRALDILFALVERAGELVGKNELIARVWPDTEVEEATLRVHVAALRKVLGDGKGDVRYVQNVTGRGYIFVAPVTRLNEERPTLAIHAAAAERRQNLPAPLKRMIGRSELVGVLVARLLRRRFVTIVGPGGIGKTTVALATAGKLSASYGHSACFVDLASIVDPLRLPIAVASALGVGILSDNPVTELLAFLGDKHLTIVLDNCEHVIEAAATLAEKALKAAPGVNILATSREPLRCEGEWVHRLPPLEMPPPSTALTAVEALAYPAIQLFTERAMANSDSFELHDADVSIVAGICRRLDGIPLAIELAAVRVDLFGLRELATRLENCLQLLTHGRRTALPRHQTLRATLDWSYDLLSEAEQVILRRIAIFPTSFDLASAIAVAADDDISAPYMFDGITNLTAKSLVVADVTSEPVLFRLLDTTRAYALEKLEASNESARISRRHAELCFTDWDAAEAQALGTAAWLATYGRKINDGRVALDWCFSPDGDASIGVKLTAATAPVWFLFFRMDENRKRLERALQALAAAPTSNAALEMRLNAALGFALASSGDYSSAVDFSERARLNCIDSGDAGAMMTHRLMALTHHFAGNQATAFHYAERTLSHPSVVSSIGNVCRIDNRIAAQAILCRVLWVQGLPDQAIRAAEDSIAAALSANHALSICFALFCACAVAVWAGDAAAADRFVAMLRDHSARHSLAYWQFWGRCFETALELRQRDAMKKVGDCPELLRDPLLGPLHLDLLGTLSEQLVGAEAIARAETGGAGWCTAEILRAKGERILKESASDAAFSAETLFLQSLNMGHQQGALSWELRTTTSFARLRRDQGRIREARDMLAPIYARFIEGFGTADLVTAKTLLEELAALM
jgi:predicted ATPase/DNA-binding winged helix-turn-helix (wHTH) protein